MTIYKIDRALNKKELAEKAVSSIKTQIELVLQKRERAKIALAGGSTPEETYRLLGKEDIPWQRVDVFLGDERWIEPNDEQSNSLLIRNTLLGSTPGSRAKFYPVPVENISSPQISAELYQELLQRVCPGNPPVFDLILLGLGDDGHTASLFPGQKIPYSSQCLVSTSFISRRIDYGMDNGLTLYV